ncbi:MAG: NAD(P)/FAD-dependent oxidoreductase [Burkholderiaceae bacterium]|jgi:sulfide dehydrogenase [flavocytochrome c] flavoprotein chain|nr:NAD(P)/FAD-dependent oxidoreductase [Burkholderiaceae bacterium]MDP4970295.1 NAD(P)/FAD-dependent oxidoreductase [Burkholderiaceae bacterium]MDP5111128.1 NAD(P)/FAD-dependent oxidoreductase [Burkholderiaceae bacterium]
MNRRHFLGQSAAVAGLAFGLNGQASASSLKSAQIVVVGAGYGGATTAKYLRMLSNNTAQVTLIEPNPEFISCPLSNLVVGGSQQLSALSVPYTGLAKNHGVKMVKDMVASIDRQKKTVQLASGQTVKYDKLVLSPGIGLMMDKIEGLEAANKAGVTLQAWKAGAETTALHKQIAEMRDGGVYALSIPLAPYRCPPGPYERVCQVANYLQKHKPKSKVLVFDANQDVTSKGKLFKAAWAKLYPGIIQYSPEHNVTAVDAKTRTIKFEVQEDVKADVLNILPPMRAGDLIVKAGLADANGRWSNVNFLNFEAVGAKDIHIIGDSIQVAPAMPKSGHMANQHAKVTAAAIIAELSGFAVNPQPVLTNTCYSFVNPTEVVHVASVHQYVPAEKTFKTVPGSGGLSPAPTALEGTYAWGWAKNIWADSLV